MATFLTTAKMNPELAARVEASVSGRRAEARGAGGSGRRGKRLVALARLVFVIAVVGGLWALVASRRRAERELVGARGSFAATVRAEASDLSAEERTVVPRLDAWLVRLAGAYDGDLVDPELRGPNGLSSTLRQAAIYVRGPLEAFGGSPGQRRSTAMTSGKDAFVLCLVDPPSARGEAALLNTTRGAYSATLETKTAHVRRLGEAMSGLPFLENGWADGLERVTDANELARLREDFHRAPIARAKEAARARLFLVAIDEPGDGTGPTELDGERPHAIRVALVDVKTSRLLLRLRRRVDPSWITPSRRPTYAAGLDGCKLALDVRDAALSASP